MDSRSLALFLVQYPGKGFNMADALTPVDRRKCVRRHVKSMEHSVDSNITNRYIDSFPLAQQMEFNSRLLKLNDDADILEELKGFTPEQIKALIALVKNS